jgi:hypothetical protein
MTPGSLSLVGRTPRSAADAPVGLLALCMFQPRVQGDPRGPGGPPHTSCQLPREVAQ